jgi:uncharacterized caspase-like protein
MQRAGLDLPEVFQQVRQEVLTATGERQTPWDSSSLVRSFYFVPPPAEPAKDAPPAVAEAPQDGKPETLAPIAGLVAEAKTKDASARRRRSSSP